MLLAAALFCSAHVYGATLRYEQGYEALDLAVRQNRALGGGTAAGEWSAFSNFREAAAAEEARRYQDSLGEVLAVLEDRVVPDTGAATSSDVAGVIRRYAEPREGRVAELGEALQWVARLGPDLAAW